MIAMDQPDPAAEPREYSSTIQAAIAITAMGLLLLGCVLVLAPFFSAILWGILLCFSTWGIYCELRRMLGERSSLAALTMTLLLASLVVAPFVIVGSSLADNADRSYWELVELGSGVLEGAERLILHTPVRTLDALHIASALVLQMESGAPLPFATADARQREAADHAGLKVVWVT
jgi:predicted PurR-regulated permease PerM